MADPKVEKNEKTLDETVADNKEGELSGADVEKVVGGYVDEGGTLHKNTRG